MEAGEALDTYLRTEFLRRRTRAAIGGMWLAPMVFGGLMLLSLSLVVSTWGLWPITIYWLVAGPLGCGAVYLYYRRKERRLRVSGEVIPEVVASVALFFAAILLAGAGGLLNHPAVWWAYASQVAWGLPVLGIVVVPPLGAPIAVLLGYGIVAFLRRSPKYLALGLGVGGAILTVGFVALTIAYKAMSESVLIGPNGVGVSTMSKLGWTVAFRVAPTVAYALILVVTAVLLRRDGGRLP